MSSITTALTPTLSKLFTVNSKCSVFPPVSASNIIGLVVTSNISLTILILDVISIASISGFPLAVESVNELDQTPSKTAGMPPLSTTVVSAIKPLNAL